MTGTLRVKEPVTTAADDTFNFFSFFVSKTNVDISCDSSAKQMIHMKCHNLLSFLRREAKILLTVTSPEYVSMPLTGFPHIENIQGPVVQSIVSLMSLLRVISLTVLADSIHNILIFFAEKM